MPIAVQCANCERRVRAPDTAAGKTGKCPNCCSEITIPLLVPRSFSPVIKTACRCPNCGESVNVPSSTLGVAKKCSRCKQSFKTGGFDDLISEALKGPPIDRERHDNVNAPPHHVNQSMGRLNIRTQLRKRRNLCM